MRQHLWIYLSAVLIGLTVLFGGAGGAYAHDQSVAELPIGDRSISIQDTTPVHCHGGAFCSVGIGAIVPFPSMAVIRSLGNVTGWPQQLRRSYELAGFDPPPPRVLSEL